MKAFLANLKHAAHNNRPVSISGGIFSPAECKEVVDLMHDIEVTLKAMTFTIETVAHLRNMEVELLPIADKARFLLARVNT